MAIVWGSDGEMFIESVSDCDVIID